MLGGVDDQAAGGDAFETLQLSQEEPRFVLVRNVPYSGIAEK